VFFAFYFSYFFFFAQLAWIWEDQC